MTVILAPTMRDAEIYAYEHGIPPKSRDTVLVPTNSHSSLNRLRGISVHREDVYVAGDVLGRYHDEAMRMLEIAYR